MFNLECQGSKIFMEFKLFSNVSPRYKICLSFLSGSEMYINYIGYSN